MEKGISRSPVTFHSNCFFLQRIWLSYVRNSDVLPRTFAETVTFMKRPMHREFMQSWGLYEVVPLTALSTLWAKHGIAGSDRNVLSSFLV